MMFRNRKSMAIIVAMFCIAALNRLHDYIFKKEISIIMACPFLSGENMLFCTALQVYIPSIFELSEYCQASRYTMCPFYIEKDTKASSTSSTSHDHRRSRWP